MRKLLKASGVLIAALLVFIASPVIYSTARGYTTWWLPTAGSVRVDGLKTGYLHKNWSGSFVIVTRTDTTPRQSYIVAVSDSRHVTSCGHWHAPPRFLPFPFGDVNTPCMGFFFDDSELKNVDLPHSSTASIRPGMIEFTTNSGKTVTANW